ncbi:TRAP transporter substrate-binding protein [Pseudoflavonifractor phocaeensis]|uniref:TRAP transporter substrate-binding protein n=1 Tax=Pseudoflavonifractor phocaeensis TaxID=1870988 RepID=UPI001F1E50B6|nr:TRAP transporter substrate-binding protein [Pseudoflavonifractor phocaeensis]MCF2595615.1 TRAP transporter substrate-binding protein [Pseudoflavonifractor phocaeensis]
MKRTLATLLALTLVCGMFSACSKNPSSSASGTSSGAISSSSQPTGISSSIVDVSSLSVEEASKQAANVQYGADTKVVRFGNAGALGETGPTACQYYCDLANIAFNGKYRFDFYPSEQLGNETTMLENMQMGLQEVMMTTLSTMATYSPDLNILDMAFCFTSSEQAQYYIAQNEQIWKDLDDAGYVFVAYNLQRNPRMLFCTWPLENASDMKGMKYRIPNLPIFEANARAMGATPVVTAYSEYTFALMQGIVDGGDSAKDAYYSAGFYESAPYASEVDFAYPFESIFFAKSFWDTLPAEDQEVFKSLGSQVEKYYNDTIKDAWAEMKTELIDKGVTFVDCDRQSFIDATSQLGYELQETDLFKTEKLYEKVLAWNAEFEKANPA